MKKLILLISFVGAFSAARYGVTYYQKYDAVKIVDAEMNAIRAEARAQHSDEPEVLAVQEIAQKKIKDKLNAKGTKKEKTKTAAGSFFGFYLVNTRQRKAYCDSQGEDISPFVSAFAAAHVEEYDSAIKALSAESSDIDQLFEMTKHQMAKAVEQDMAYIAKENEVTLAEACQLISDHADILIPDMHLSVMQPVVYQALMSAE